MKDHPSATAQPRRPPGWRAPGPPPTGPHDSPDLQLRPGEDLSYLTGDWRIFQLADGHRWSLDDLLTAWVARRHCERPPASLLDLGCGIGSVLLMMAWSYPKARGLGIEAQAVSVELARRSLRWNGVDQRCEVRHGDLSDTSLLAAGQRYELITGTPPYFPRGRALESPRPQWAECHTEYRGGVETYCAAAARHLATGGRFVMCAAARDVERVSVAAQHAGLFIHSRRDVIPREGKAALFSVYVMHAGGDQAHGLTSQEPHTTEACVEPPLVVRDQAGRRTPAYRQARHDMGMPP